jgi:hypothetical protein
VSLGPPERAGTVAGVRTDRSSSTAGPRRPAQAAPPGLPRAADPSAATARTGPGTVRSAVVRLWAGWLLTRAVLVVGVLTGQTFGAQQNVQGDLRIYAAWAYGLGHGGGLPVGDDRWQYPPGAAVAFVLPEFAHTLSVLPYRVAFVALSLLADAAVTAALARRDRGAALFWVAGITALGPVALARFDLLPAAAALAAVLAVSAGRPGRAGFHLGVGTLLKVWPVLLVIALPWPAARTRGSGWSWAAAARLAGGLLAAVAAFAAIAVLTGWWRDALGFVGAQRARGLQVEAVAATPFVVAHMVGGPAPTYSYGALQFDGPVARGVATACSLAEAVTIVLAALWWWLRARPPAGGGHGPVAARGDGPAALAATLAARAVALVTVVVVTARVLSPQYLVWLLALTAAGLAVGGRTAPAGQPDARPAPGGYLPATMLAVAALSQVIYPWRYNDVIQGRIVLTLLLVVRNVGLVTACWWAVRAAAARPAPPPRPRRPARGR